MELEGVIRGRATLVAHGVLVLASLALTACAPTAPLSSPPPATGSMVAPSAPGGVKTSEESPRPSVSPQQPDDSVARLLGALAANGADVELTGPFMTDPVGGEGVGLCVDGRGVNVYVFPSADEAEAVESRIDPDDPSNLGTAMVSWLGSPRFWRFERLLVLYLGDDPAVEAGLTAVLGDPFAEGQGRGGLPGEPSAC